MTQGILRVFIGVLSLLAVATFLFFAMRDIESDNAAHPTEAAMLEHAARMVEGKQVYSEPMGAEPAIMPGLPAVSYFLIREWGAHLWVVRFVSLIALLLLAGVIGAIVGTECGSWTYALASGSIVLIGAGLLGMIPGLARPEALMLLLVALGFMLMRYTEGIIGAILGAIFLSAGFFVDQQAAWFAAGAYVAMALESRRRLVAYAVTLGVLVGGGYAYLSYLFGPWFNFAVFDGPLHALRYSAGEELRFLSGHLLGTLGIFTITILLSFALHARPWYGKGGIWLYMGATAVLAGLSATTASQALLPTIVVLSALGTISMQRVTRHLAAWGGSEKHGGECVVLAALALQIFVLCASIPADRWMSLARTIGLVA